MDDTETAQVKMTMDEMLEVRRAVSARIGNWIAGGELGGKEEEIHLLMGAGEKLDAHIDDCLDQYQGKVARHEAQILDDEEALRKFMEGDK